MKRFIAGLLVCGLSFSPFATAEETKRPAGPAEIKLQKTTEEANRNRELLEIWKDHVRTVTQERDAAYKELEALRSAAKTGLPAPAPTGTMAQFGGIETQALAPMPARNLAAASAAPVVPPGDFQGYQDTIRELRAQLDEAKSANQRLQKQMFEAGNDKTLIIRDKEQAISKIEALSTQLRALQDENKNLNDRLRSSGSAPASGSAQAIVASYAPDNTLGQDVALKNAYAAQSEKLKQAVREKDLVIERANELQVKYVDLQSAHERLKAERAIPVVSAAKPAPAVKSQEDQFEINHLKSQNAKLKAELDKTRSDLEKNAAALSTSLKSSQESVSRTLDSLKKENADLRALVARQRADLEAAPKPGSLPPASDPAKWKEQLDTLIGENRILKSRLGEQDAEVMSARRELENVREAMRKLQEASKTPTKTPAEKDADRQYMERVLSDMTYKMKRREEAFTQMLRQVQALKAENQKLANARQTYDTALRAIRAQAAAPASSGVENARLRSLENENTALKKQAADLRASLESANALAQKLRDKNAALGSSTVDREELLTLRAQKESVQNQIAELRADLETANELNRKTREKNVALASQVDSLSSNQQSLEAEKQAALRLRAENQKIAAERDGLLSQIDGLNASLRAARSDNDAASGLKIQYQQSLAEKEELKAQLDRLSMSLKLAEAEKQKGAQLESERIKLAYDNDTLRNQIQSLKADLQTMKAEKDTASLLRAEKNKLSSENETMKKAMIDVEREAQTNEDRVAELRQRNAYLERTNREQQATIEELKASLQKSLDDIQNLKTNFQSYLESLVSSFEERQKKDPGAANPAEESNAP